LIGDSSRALSGARHTSKVERESFDYDYEHDYDLRRCLSFDVRRSAFDVRRSAFGVFRITLLLLGCTESSMIRIKIMSRIVLHSAFGVGRSAFGVFLSWQ